MSPRRFLGEVVIMAGSVLGAIIGYSAGARYSPELQMALAFGGMALGGAFADLCLRGGK